MSPAQDERAALGEGPDAGPAQNSRQRIALAAALGCFVIVVGSVAIAGTGGEESRGPDLAECVEKWNRSEDALGTGSHVVSLHGYTEAWVVRLGPSLERNPETGGDCAVVFPAPQPDPEPEFAATVLGNDGWRPLSRRPGVETEQLGELQREALAVANARLGPNGTITGAF